MTPHQDRQHHTHSIPEHSRNPYHTRNVMVISSTQNPHNSPCVLLRMHMQPRKMIQIGHSFRIYNPLILIHIPSVSHYHSFHQIISSHFSVELYSKIYHEQLSLHFVVLCLCCSRKIMIHTQSTWKCSIMGVIGGTMMVQISKYLVPMRATPTFRNLPWGARDAEVWGQVHCPKTDPI